MAEFVKVLVDTSIWSLALRRKASIDGEILDKLKSLILSNQVVLIGPVRQELLSGIADEYNFARLKLKLDGYIDFPIATQDYVTAAQLYNCCRSRGIQGSMVDFLICAVAINNDMTIFTSDKDFNNFAKYLPIKLFT